MQFWIFHTFQFIYFDFEAWCPCIVRPWAVSHTTHALRRLWWHAVFPWKYVYDWYVHQWLLRKHSSASSLLWNYMAPDYGKSSNGIKWSRKIHSVPLFSLSSFNKMVKCKGELFSKNNLNWSKTLNMFEQYYKCK